MILKKLSTLVQETFCAPSILDLYKGPMGQSVVLILGSGVAGLSLALKLAGKFRVILCTKASSGATNSSMAQGGIAAVLSATDHFEDHVQDTLNAGAGLCKPEVVQAVVAQAPDRIRELIDWGVHFDLDDEARLALTREGGHSHRRIVHIADHTGLAVHQSLMAKVVAHPNIEILENHLGLELITKTDEHGGGVGVGASVGASGAAGVSDVAQIDLGAGIGAGGSAGLDRLKRPGFVSNKRVYGAHVLNIETRKVESILAAHTVLATGGAGKVYLYTSNWDGATGDGLAMAHRAGARLANLEFMQFHPTCLYHPDFRNFLISEALRGEGGQLVNERGEKFMGKYHAMGSLAPRDIVARSIDSEMKRTGAAYVGLDMTHLPREVLMKRFPVIFKKCMEYGIDMSLKPIPVVPAAHYLCGGVVTDLAGQTDLAGLWAIGETACTGLHGANRLASNSLLECLVMAHECASTILLADPVVVPLDLADEVWPQSELADEEELVVVDHMWEEVRRLMWNYVGIVRSERRLMRAFYRLELLSHEIEQDYQKFRTHPHIEELRNLTSVALLTVRCALKRKESRGIHYNLDYPKLLEIAEDSVV